MQAMVFALPVLLVTLFPKTGAAIPMHRLHRFGLMDPMLMFHPAEFDDPEAYMMQGTAFDDPEFQQVKLLCEEYIHGSKKFDLNDRQLEYVVINECEKYQLGKPVSAARLRFLQNRVTNNPLAAKVMNRKH